jgi:hypothetical protein
MREISQETEETEKTEDREFPREFPTKSHDRNCLDGAAVSRSQQVSQKSEGSEWRGRRACRRTSYPKVLARSAK